MLGSSPTALENRQNDKLDSQHSVKHATSQLLLLQYEPFAVGFWGVGGSRSGSTRHWYPTHWGAAPQGIPTEELAAHSGFSFRYFVISKTC